MKIELSLPRSRVVVDESIELHVRLCNDGPTPVRVPDPFVNDAWQPAYVLTGPAFPTGRRFTARSSTSRDARPVPDDVPLAMIELPPGGTHEGEIPLSQWITIDAPGAYSLVAELELSAERAGGTALAVRSAPLSLTLDALDASSASVGVDAQQGPPAGLWVSFVHAGREPPAIYDALVLEDRPDLGELQRHDLVHRRDVAAGVEAVHVPWHHDDRMAALAAWRTWMQGGSLVVDDSPLGVPMALPLSPGSSVVTPVWQDAREQLDVLVRAPSPGGGQQLELVRFGSHGPPAPPTGAVVWRSEPRGSIATARLALGPVSGGSLRRAVAVESRGDDLVLSCFAVEAGGPGAPIAEVTLPQVNPVPGLGLVLRVTPEGRTRVWVLADAKHQGWQVYLGRMEFDVDGRLTAAIEKPRPLVTLPSPLVEAALELVQPAGDGSEPLVWALRTDDRRVLWSRDGSAPRWYKTLRPSVLAVPMQLRPMSQATYLATQSPGRAPALVTLEE
ncbi:hypothetical protein [Paraliomyxa miuraensis]|uniref:hypothetical protein n=1 Tax=Paraliomyxa miuraensis TaxID=376150 RepID=UPI00225B8C03|nr:hypothetical protein [Paraliomyxa miuraensis]MCX4240636.1 hypothetical protein [Paraliomyxa miuraensis]